ncbi:MAG TPA: ankyrin repeat domain-containing protein [Chloroflexota bacterium]|nr:ankyrin repeat domain-containing protein [Chloroflexota bacterium]
MATLRADAAVATTLVQAIRGGDLTWLRRMLVEHPPLANARVVDAKGAGRTPLHIATDWPGHFPNGPTVVMALIDAGADPNAPMTGSFHTETPLHWAASTDDVEVAEVLVDRGADLEASGASIAGGTPLDDAVGYGCWRVARLLVARGARVDKLWHAAALGMNARLAELLAGPPAATPEQINQAFWHACQGGQPRTAAHLLALGADPSWVPPYSKKTALDAAGALDTARQALIEWLRARGARSSDQTF